LRRQTSEIKTTDQVVLIIVHELKKLVAEREKEIARAIVSDSYTHGRLQGNLDGLDESLSVIDSILSGNYNEES
jgi:hypothetical protein